MNLEELLKETDALTYVNSLKVTLTELKSEVSSIEEMGEYMQQACERCRKLVRKADNQYRLVTKIIQRESPTVQDLVVQDELENMDLEELMEQND